MLNAGSCLGSQCQLGRWHHPAVTRLLTLMKGKPLAQWDPCLLPTGKALQRLFPLTELVEVGGLGPPQSAQSERCSNTPTLGNRSQTGLINPEKPLSRVSKQGHVTLNGSLGTFMQVILVGKTLWSQGITLHKMFLLVQNDFRGNKMFLTPSLAVDASSKSHSS